MGLIFTDYVQYNILQVFRSADNQCGNNFNFGNNSREGRIQGNMVYKIINPRCMREGYSVMSEWEPPILGTPGPGPYIHMKLGTRIPISISFLGPGIPRII